MNCFKVAQKALTKAVLGQMTLCSSSVLTHVDSTGKASQVDVSRKGEDLGFYSGFSMELFSILTIFTLVKHIILLLLVVARADKLFNQIVLEFSVEFNRELVQQFRSYRYSL